MKIISLVAATILLALPAPTQAPDALDRLLPERVEPVYRALDEQVDAQIAMETVAYMDQFWRVAGNPGFNRSIDYLRASLTEAGVPARIEEFPNEGHGWEAVGLKLVIHEGDSAGNGTELAGTAAINSFSTPESLNRSLIDVGDGTADADYDGRTVKGAVVLAAGPARRVWEQAVAKRDAAGIISYYGPPYTEPSSITWESVPYDAKRRAFAVKVARTTAGGLKAQAAAGARVSVEIQTRFHPGPNRNLIAEIPGRIRPDERIVIVAHVQEPGANDNASGCGTLLALVHALQKGIASGRLPPPGRTLTFLWVDEIRGSEQWLKDDPGRASKAQYMFSLDMTGQDTAKTGGTFLIEKQPDPSAVWERPSDPHTEWGASEVAPASLKGSLLNDLHLAVCLRRARDTGWVVRTNPYEGGSDHTVFGRERIPSLLNWHFTDRYYHTNMDRVDKVSAREMKHVGVSVATSAWLLASATGDDARAIGRLIARAAAMRMETEERNAAELARAGKHDPVTERAVVEAWKKWYAEALESVERLPVSSP